uniref:Pollen Ole e 1 allergen and extensin family protein n=1 Tax=Panagrellus redivivus TaxID=6233 RepID=A0A7E4VV85_PANRE
MASGTWRFGALLLVMTIAGTSAQVELKPEAIVYEAKLEPFEILIDRSSCPPSSFQKFDRTCFCYTTKSQGFADAGCGNGFGYVCSTTKKSNFILYHNGDLASFESKQKDKIPPMIVQTKGVKDNYLIKTLELKMGPQAGCGKVIITNVEYRTDIIDESAVKQPECPHCTKKCNGPSRPPVPQELS